MDKAILGPAIAGIWTPKRVVIVASGRENKIHAVGDIYFGVTGLVRRGAFDAASIVAEALAEEDSLGNRIAVAREELESPLTASLQNVFETDKDFFKQNFAGRDALTLLLFCMKDGEVFLARIGFGTKMRGKNIVLKTRQREYPNETTTQMSVALFAAGVSEAVEKQFLAGTPEQQALVYPEKALQGFAPAHIVRLSATGVTQDVLE